jgi:hypothetical protein
VSVVADKLNVDLRHSCWSADHLLAHCENYRVESAAGRLGYVEEVIWVPDGSEPAALHVFGIDGRLAVPIADVLELHPDGEWIVVRAPSAAPPFSESSVEPRNAPGD